MLGRYYIALGLVFISMFSVFGQSNTSLEEDQTIKGQMVMNPHEVGIGVSYQYYNSDLSGLQVNLDALFPVSDRDFGEDYSLSGFGIRLNPEYRFYPNRKRENRTNSFFIGGGPVFKTLKMSETEWVSHFENNFGGSYSRLQTTTYRNNSAGVMGRVGMEGYIGKPKKIVFEFSYGFGLTQNWVRRVEEPNAVSNRGWNFFEIFEDISVSNRNSGTLPYIDFRFSIGYRLGKSWSDR